MWTLETIEKESVKGCECCGRTIKYVYVITNTNTGDIVRVGSECATKYLSNADACRAEASVKMLKKVEKIRAQFSSVAEIKSAFGWLVGQIGRKGVEKYFPEIV